MPPLPALAGVTRPQRLLGLSPASSARHLSHFVFPRFLVWLSTLWVRAQGVPAPSAEVLLWALGRRALGPVPAQPDISLPVSLEGDLQSTGRSSRKTSRVSAILCRGVIAGQGWSS